ncbi:MAG: hypothetical protein ACRDL6_09785 [Solirubrobacterales bacterium]
MAAAQAVITVALDLRSDDLSGVVRLDGEGERPFLGWLGLIAALQGAADEARGVNSPTDAGDGTWSGSWKRPSRDNDERRH